MDKKIKRDKEWDKHPSQHIQEEWQAFQNEAPLTLDRYNNFIKWMIGYVKERNLEGY